MKYIFFCFLFLIMSCKSGKDIGNTDIVIGTARNDKPGAVLSSKGEVYLITGLNSWDSVYVNKTVKSKGAL